MVDPVQGTETFKFEKDEKLRVEGKITAFDLDKEDNLWTFILTETPNTQKPSGHDYHLNILYKS